MISMPKKRRQAGMYTTRKDEITGWLFTAPALICFLMFVLIPTCAMIVLSFTQYRMLTPPEWTGVDNYVRLFTTDAKISKVALNTLKLSSVSVVISISIGLVLALLITSRKNGLYSYVIRLFYFFPNIVASSFIAIVWAILLSKDTGVVNYYLHQLFGSEPIGFLTDQNYALWAIILIDVWRNVGFIMFILLAGIRNISSSYYEAAALDGATGLQIAGKITIPLLTPSILLVMVIQIIGALKSFDIPNIMTEGGPNDATRTMAMYIYDMAFTRMSMGYACSVSVVFVLVIMFVTVFQFGLSSKWVHYD